MLQLMGLDLFGEGVETVEEGGCCHDGRYFIVMVAAEAAV
jgi:hypothetical protein